MLWSIANEPESDTEAARDYFEPLFALTRELDPTRPVGFVNVMLAPHGECLVSQFADVIMLNRYYGWYVNTGDLAAAERALARPSSTAWAGDGKPIIITEYGADTVAGLHSVVRRSRGPRSTRSSTSTMNHRVFDRIDAVVGEQVWNFADFATKSGHRAASTATRRASSPATARPRPPRTRSAPAGPPCATPRPEHLHTARESP